MTEHTEHLAENHKRIWLQPLCCTEERCWCEDPQPCDECGLPAIEYVRADLVTLPLHDDAAIRAAATRTLAEGMKKFAPDLMAEFVARWNYSKLTPDEKLERFLAVLSEPRAAKQDQGA